MKGSPSERVALKVDVTGPVNILFAGASAHFSVRNCTGWRGDGVKAELSLNRYGQGPRSQEVGEEGVGDCLYLTLHYHHQNVSCIKMDSRESCFNASFIGRGKV